MSYFFEFKTHEFIWFIIFAFYGLSINIIEVFCDDGISKIKAPLTNKNKMRQNHL